MATNSQKGVSLIKNVVKNMLQKKSYDSLLTKINIVSGGEGRCVAEFKVEDEFQNKLGSLHGGCTAWLIDIISTLALTTHGDGLPGVSVDMHITYLKAAFADEEIVIDARTIRAGRSLAFLEVELRTKGTGAVIAKGSHTKFIG